MALITTLLFLGVFLLILAGILKKASVDGWFTMQGRQDVVAQAAAESGIALALSELSQDGSWAVDLIDQRLPETDSYFTLRWGPAHCVNNLASDSATDGPMGPATVPSRSAYLVVEGRSGSKVCHLEAIVGPHGLQRVYPALITSGNVSFGKNVDVTGVMSLANPKPTQADIISTKGGASSDIISWTGDGHLNVEGSIVSNGEHASAISSTVRTGHVTGDFEHGQSNAVSTDINIEARVAAKSSATQPVVTGSTTLTAGDYYFPSGLSLAGGDIDLQGANLYVRGDLKLNGSLKGKGAVFVTGETTLSGDATIVTGDEQNVALYSKGDIKLAGFDGTQALANWVLTSGNDTNNVPYSEHFNHMQAWLKRLGEIYDTARVAFDAAQDMPASSLPIMTVNDHNPKIFGNAQVGGGYTSEFDYYLDILAHKTEVGSTSYRGNAFHWTQSNPIGELYHMVDARLLEGRETFFWLG